MASPVPGWVLRGVTGLAPPSSLWGTGPIPPQRAACRGPRAPGQRGWGGFRRKRNAQEFGITGKHLVTYMSNSVAVGLDDDSVFTALQRLEQEFGITGKNLVTFLSNSVAVRLDDDSFLTALQLLEQDSGVTGRTWSRS